MNERAIIILAETIGLPFIDQAITPLVTAVVISDPGASDEAIEDAVSGQMQHQARQKVHWIVDFVWPAIAPYIEKEVANVLPNVRALVPKPNPTPSTNVG